MQTKQTNKRLRAGVLIALLSLFNAASAFAQWTNGNEGLIGKANPVVVVDDPSFNFGSVTNLTYALFIATQYLTTHNQLVLDPGPEGNWPQVELEAVSGEVKRMRAQLPGGEDLTPDILLMSELN